MSVWSKTKGKENQWTLFYDSCTLYMQVIKKSKQIQRVFTATHNIHLLNKRLNNKQPLSNSDAQTGKFVEQLQDEPKIWVAFKMKLYLWISKRRSKVLHRLNSYNGIIFRWCCKNFKFQSSKILPNIYI